MVAEACDDGAETFACGGEINESGEYDGILVEEDCNRFNASTTAFGKDFK